MSYKDFRALQRATEGSWDDAGKLARVTVVRIAAAAYRLARVKS
ncbi:MAG: hypothetical protein O3A47_13570 [Chloroflexi bacterium]|nr:hypothetical protein [Chloroflexota bacterium]